MELKKEAYEQNYQQFRSLNQIMWQIPVLAMTLTGGLWFGVSRISENLLLVSALLVTATIGNLALAIVLRRFRYVMAQYLDWLQNAYEDGFVEADGLKDASKPWTKFCTSAERVRQMFSCMLYWSAGMSALLLIVHMTSEIRQMTTSKAIISERFYDQHAEALADGYESVSFEEAYPFLLPLLSAETLRVLDVGSGTGRDAAWISERGHQVIAAEPSSAMRRIARELHSKTDVKWIDAKLPELEDAALQNRNFDVILVNAVWMHIPPTERQDAMDRLHELVKLNGRVFVSLRLGPSDDSRGMYNISVERFVQRAEEVGFSVVLKGEYGDLLGRSAISWKMYELQKL